MDVEEKGPKKELPWQLANPANCTGFALSHYLYDA